MTIDATQYFGKPHSDEQQADALELLSRVNPLLDEAALAGAYAHETDLDTGCEISGAKGGDGDGGFRTPLSRTGVPSSSHREAKAVDVHDPEDKLDSWLSSFEGENGANSKLEQYGLYRESPSATPSWVHLTTRAPGSGRRTFNP